VGSIVVALLAWWFPYKKHQRGGERVERYDLMYNPERRLEPFTMGMTNGDAERRQLADGAYGDSHRGFGCWGG